ncbi:serine protease [Burkholderia cenocepacia]|uniref:serine protease n=1 Tax=Burkholderia cenocepacia TaxID=95486 RepID=UPI0021AB65BC|nr:serine protease [Burkholderia cenocepacia]MCW5154993.1 serine protease [Burkholderia cenocepacia]MCW5163046.1 serine protease [Burkholderia cenocepacia]MCW5170766.1 serine protease [Burkholderia cenocepacia]
MQDITGHYAIPLAHPFSDVPPPYGRRRRPFVASRRARQHVFDIYGPSRVPAPATDGSTVAKAARPAKAVRAADFGSDNRAWVRPHPLRRRWRLTLMACALFGATCILATHLVDERQHAAEHDAAYSAAIAIAAAPTAAVAATEVARATGHAAEVAIVRADRAAPTDAQMKAAATVVAETASAEARALHVAGSGSAGEPVAVAMAVASNAVVAEAAPARADRASSARKPVAAPAARRAAKSAGASRGKTARQAEANAPAAKHAAIAARGATPRAQPAARAADTPTTAPVSSSAQAVGMTATEFTQWLAATRDTSRSAAGGTDLSVELPSHTRLIGH